ncbi:ABC transporter permease [Pikeienuella sp. HZG-20]|uniref:ABC transporter permease n=1 Tax=Paludibacillus litoralis TaxID=3133267 RepID=UPI0030EB9CDB
MADDLLTLLPEAERAARRRARTVRAGAILACQVGILVFLLGFWEWATVGNRELAFLFGSPSAVWTFIVRGWLDGTLLRDTYVTGAETVIGFLLGNAMGTLLGLSLWYSQFVARVVQPYVIAIGAIPIIALAPIIIIWFGTGLASKVVMATLSVVVIALLTSYKGASSVDPDEMNLFRTLGASKFQMFRRLVIPSALSDIFSGLRLTVGFALIGAIIGEFMSSSEGLGHAIFQAGSLYNIPKVFAGLVATIALALVLTWVVGKLERLLTPWKTD